MYEGSRPAHEHRRVGGRGTDKGWSRISSAGIRADVVDLPRWQDLVLRIDITVVRTRVVRRSALQLGPNLDGSWWLNRFNR
jgi:hypothetical protein